MLAFASRCSRARVASTGSSRVANPGRSGRWSGSPRRFEQTPGPRGAPPRSRIRGAPGPAARGRTGASSSRARVRQEIAFRHRRVPRLAPASNLRRGVALERVPRRPKRSSRARTRVPRHSSRTGLSVAECMRQGVIFPIGNNCLGNASKLANRPVRDDCVEHRWEVSVSSSAPCVERFGFLQRAIATSFGSRGRIRVADRVRDSAQQPQVFPSIRDGSGSIGSSPSSRALS